MAEPRSPYLPPRETVLIHPTAVDFSVPDSDPVSQKTAWVPDFRPAYVQDALEILNQVLGLKAGRNSVSRALSLPAGDTSVLRPMSVQSLQVMERVAEVATAYGMEPMYYGLADVNSVPREDHENLQTSTYKGTPIIVRPEEGLTIRAARIAHEIRDHVTLGEIEGARMLDDHTIEHHDNSVLASFSLYGYTFRHDPAAALESVRFSEFPACEPFLAATTLEQLQLADAVVRIVPRTFKKKEYAARWILRNLGVDDLPVMSVAVGDTGGVNKVIQWSASPGNILSAISSALKTKPIGD